MVKYQHTDRIHNPESAKVIVPYVYDLMEIESVVDFGCGLGNFLKCFKEMGVESLLGLDGPWVDPELLFSNIEPNEFKEVDLEEVVILQKKFDLAVCLEVAEHLEMNKASILVESLIRASETILFSAAIPGQGGQNHINEQWITYWANLFAKYNFYPADIIRLKYWNDDNVKWWYRQNMVFFVSNKSELAKERTEIRDLVHPELFTRKIERLRDLEIRIDRQLQELNKLREVRSKFQKLKHSPISLFKLLIKSIVRR